MASSNKNEKFNNRYLVPTICFLLLFGFAATSLVSYYLARQSIETHIRKDSLPLTNENIYSHVQRDLIKPVLISSLMAKDTFVRDWAINGEQDQAKIINYLNEIQQQYQTVTSFFVSEATRRYYHSSGTLKTVGENDAQDQWYFDTIKDAQEYNINLDVDTAALSRTTFFINHKVYDFNKQLLGVIGVGLASDMIRQQVDQYQQLFNRTVYFVNDSGDVTLHGTSFTKQSSLDKMQGMTDISDKILSKTGGSFEYNNGDRKVFVNTRYIKELDWHIVTEEPDSQPPEILRALYINLLLSTLVTLLVGWLINRLIQRHRLKLQKLVTIDHLTKVSTRQGFEPILEQMLKLASRKNEPLSIMLVDLDHFKRINDQLGHLEGDAVLKAIAKILMGTLRECDAICRWGGEEFIITLANTGKNGAYIAAQKIQQSLADNIATGENIKVPVTISIGIAECKKTRS